MNELEITLRLLANPLDRLHLGVLLKDWKIEESIESIYEKCDLRSLTGEELLKDIQKLTEFSSSPVFQALEALAWGTQEFRLPQALKVIENYAHTLDVEPKAFILQDLSTWRKHWNYYIRSEQGGSQNIQSFLSQIALGTTQQPSEDGIALLTVHSAKGMEFEVVFLIAMNEGTFPDFRAKGKDLIEEKRNAFVAVTRSKRLLYVTYPKSRVMPWGDSKRQSPSRFIEDILPEE